MLLGEKVLDNVKAYRDQRLLITFLITAQNTPTKPPKNKPAKIINAFGGPAGLTGAIMGSLDV
jgi:hypothetical protein